MTKLSGWVATGNAILLFAVIQSSCTDGGASGGWYTKCTSNADCQDGLFCGDSGDYGDNFCTRACSESTECRNYFGSQAAGCELNTGTCWKWCTENAECPGDALCYGFVQCQIQDEQGPPDPPVCGNGLIEEGEDCDVGDMGNQTCLDIYPDENGVSGILACRASDCTFDTSGCDYCGNGIRAFGSADECDCGGSIYDLPDGCTDINGGPNANCSLDCKAI